MENLAVHFDYLLAVARKNLPNSLQYLAEDAVQETFYKALKNKHAFNKNRASLKTWLTSVLKNYCVDITRKKTNQTQRFDSFLAELFYQELEINEPVNMLKKYLKLLSKQDERLLLMKYSFEMSAKEIAGVLGVKSSHIPVMAKRAIDKLRKELIRKNIYQNLPRF